MVSLSKQREPDRLTDPAPGARHDRNLLVHVRHSPDGRVGGAARQPTTDAASCAGPRNAVDASGLPRHDGGREGHMGRIVYAAAMSHVLYPDYYGQNVGPHGRRVVEELMGVVRAMGRTLMAAAPDAFVVVDADPLNVFSFDAVPVLCVRVGGSVSRMVQADAIEFDRALDGLPERYPLHEDLANGILEKGVQAGFDFAASWSAPLDHAFLSPVSTLYGDRPVPPLVPFWVNCFVAPQPTAQRCFAAGRHIARVVAEGPWNVAVVATGGRRHLLPASLARAGPPDPALGPGPGQPVARGDPPGPAPPPPQQRSPDAS